MVVLLQLLFLAGAAQVDPDTIGAEVRREVERFQAE
jgi:hypothetical protein